MTARDLALILAVLVPLSTTAQAQSKDPPRDTGGTTISLSNWQAIEPEELVVNVGDLKGATIWDAEYRVRDNHIWHQRAMLGLGGFVSISHIPSSRVVYNRQVTLRVNDLDYLKQRIERSYSKRGKFVTFEESKKIYRFGRRGGWLIRAYHADARRNCWMGRIGFISEPHKGDGLSEKYDTLFEFRDCTGERSMEEMEAFLHGMKIVDSDYNRSAFERGRR